MENKVFSKSDNFKSEYSCAVVKVGELTPIEGSDFLAKTLVFGTQIVVRKDHVKEGDIMIYAANETQLDEVFLSVNNLFEISCRDKNSNASEVNRIMSEYQPYKDKADKLRNDVKAIKGQIDSMTKKANKLNKQISKKKKDNKDGSLQKEIDELTIIKDTLIKKATAKTTTYTNLKSEIQNIVKSGEHIVDEAKKRVGFFNKYGRVRCVTLKNTPSFGFLFSPSELYKYDNTITFDDIEAYVGEEFDTVNGKLFVKAFVPPIKETQTRNVKTRKAQKKLSRFDRLIDGEFFFHYDTTQLQKCISLIKPDDVVSITCKIHGTSVVVGKLHVKKKIKLPLLKNMWNKFVDFTGLFKSKRIIDYTVDYGPIYSSRTVIKNRYINEGVNEGFYKTDVWSEWGNIIYPYLSEGMTIYGEIVGYESYSDRMIQKFYDYGCESGNNKLMIYRISTSAQDGRKIEWDIEDVYAWTLDLIDRMKDNNDNNCDRIHPIDVLYHGTLQDLYPEISTDCHWHENVLEAMKKDKNTLGMELNEPMCKNEVPREGICLRIDGDKVLECFKLKTQSFTLKEAIAVDSGEVDIEMMDNYVNNGEEP